MNMQYVNLCNVVLHQSRDMNTEGLAPGIQNAVCLKQCILITIGDWYEFKWVSSMYSGGSSAISMGSSST